MGWNPFRGANLDTRPTLPALAVVAFAQGPPALGPEASAGSETWGGRREMGGSPWNYGSQLESHTALPVHARGKRVRGVGSRPAQAGVIGGMGQYGLKAKLQALLIRLHAELLKVVADGAPGEVSRRHKIEGRDACHAVVASLDDAARSVEGSDGVA